MSGAHLRLALALALSCAGPCAWAATKPSAAEQFFAARVGAHVLSVPFDTVRAQPQQYRPFLIEIRGTITGNARREDGATLIIDSPGAGTTMVEVDGAAAAYASDAGQSVRILARVPEGLIVNRLMVVALVTEFDAATYESQRPRATAPAAKPSPSPVRSTRSRSSRQQLASRGGMAARGASILEQYSAAVLYFNPRLPAGDATRIAQSIIVYSNRYGLDARLVMAVVAVESNFNAYAVSRVGAMGLGQLMPGTASDLGVDPWSPEDNIRGATRLLSGHIAQMSTRAPTLEAIKLALACYNAGAGAVKKHKGIPPYRETQNYVKKVTRLYYQMCGQPAPAD